MIRPSVFGCLYLLTAVLGGAVGWSHAAIADSASTVDELGRRALSTDAAVAAEAATALGEIGDKAAARKLAVAHMAHNDAAVQDVIARARLACADTLAAMGDERGALLICRAIYYRRKNPGTARAEALYRIDRLAPESSGAYITWGLTDHTDDVQVAAAKLRTQRELRQTGELR